MSRKSDKPKPVSVFVRCRPRNAAEKGAGSASIVECSKKEVVVRQGNSNINKKYTFDHVYGPNSTQVDVYKGVASSTIEEVLQGYNCTVFAYGQTGTGKTYTMEGDRSIGSNIPWEKDPKIGLIPRSMSHMFDRLNSQASDYSVRVSMLELYNEELFDLLSPPNSSNTKLRLFEDSARKVTRGIGSVVIQGLEEVQVMSKDEVHGLMERAMQKRQTASTLLNTHSSRSHVVFTVTVHIKTVSQDDECEEEVFKMGKLNLVDLAGSENIGKSGAQDKRAREAGNINQSLLTLGRVITALVDRAPHVPYRESKLTRLLQDSLGGRTKTSIIATVSPAHCNLEETLSTLDYANRAKSILNKPEINQRSSKKTLIKEYTAEIEKLKRDLQNVREKSGVYLDFEKFNEMEMRMKSQTQLIKDKEDELAALIDARSKISNLFSYSIKQIDGLHQKIDRKELVESQNKVIINNFIQNTTNQYAMFEQFMVQRKEELDQNNQKIGKLLEEAKAKDSSARDLTHNCLNKLMETVVKGLDTAVQQRDSQHDNWITSYFKTELIPAVRKTMTSVGELQVESDTAAASTIQLLEEEHAMFGKKLEDMEAALKYMISSADKECVKLVQNIEDKQQFMLTVRQQQQQAMEASHLETQAALGAAQRINKEAQQIELFLQKNSAHMESLSKVNSESAAELLESDREMHEGAKELSMTLKHGSDSVCAWQVKLLKDQNNNMHNVVTGVKSTSAGVSRKFSSLRDTCLEVEDQVKRARVDYAAQIAGSLDSVRSTHNLLLSCGENTPQQPHLKEIFEQRCQADVSVIEHCLERGEILQALATETTGMLQSSVETCTQSTGLIEEADSSLANLGAHVKEDLPTGTTPKRAKLNRLKLHQTSGFKLDIIESDEENGDPNISPVLDMSY